jgi:hypothetical protein
MGTVTGVIVHGCDGVVVLLGPSKPAVLHPQHCTAPLFSTTQLADPPAPTETEATGAVTHPDGTGELATGALGHAGAPQQNSVPFTPIAQTL